MILLHVLIVFFNIISINAQTPNVFFFEGPTKMNTSGNTLNIYCYVGSRKNVFQLWKSAEIHLDILSDNFKVYRGKTPEEVHLAYKEDTWIQSFFYSKNSRSYNIDPFNSSCIGIKSRELYKINFNIQNANNYFIAFFCVGVFLFIYSKSLAENTLFYYLCGITIGILGSFFVLIYLLSKFIPGRPVQYGAFIGCTVGAYFIQLVWEKFKPLFFVYFDYVMWYAIISGLISFIVCYKIGPPKDQKSKNIISWILQSCGLTLIYFSTYLFEVFCVICVFLVFIKVFPMFVINAFIGYWRRKFPPKRRLLTEEEYYIQGQIETAKALEELRGYCSSPECKQWKVMMSLKDPKKFAGFVENNIHLSEDEVEEYENSDFVLKKKHLTKLKTNHFKDDLISEDDDSSSNDFSDEY